MAKTHHPSTVEMLDTFRYEHLPPHLQEISKPICELAHSMAELLEGAELTAGLRKLRESKDCFVIARVQAKRREDAAAAG